MRNQRTTTAVFLVACLLFIVAMASTQSERQKSDIKATRTVAFVGVNVVPMDKERIIEQQTVIVQDGRISEIGPASKLKVPLDAFQIDGGGKHLMPGLADMHVHLANDDDVLFLANGVTTVRNMWGRPSHLERRKQISDGQLLGPKIYTTGPAMADIKTPEEAKEKVAAQKLAGYDAIKVLSFLKPEVYEAIIATAKEHGIPVYGHIPVQVGFEKAIRAGQLSFEHMFDFLYPLLPSESPARTALVELAQGKIKRSMQTATKTMLINPSKHANPDKIPELVTKVAASGVWICPTFVASQKLTADFESFKAFWNHPSVKYVPQKRRDFWRMIERMTSSDQWDLKAMSRGYEIQLRMFKELHDAGVKFLVGTDCFVTLFVVPGFSIHDELQNFVDAGLTPFETIRAATRDAAEFMDALDEFGTVAVGRRADLILVEANPLEDVANVTKRVGVMVRGRWFSESEMQEKLDQLAEKIAKKNTSDV